MKHIQPPEHIPGEKGTVFLAGSIEMGVAEMWQKRVVEMLHDTDWIILNPRRDDWDSTWEQSTTDRRFVGQVEWELQGIESAEKVIFYFDIHTKSPITLLELGIVSQIKRPEDIFVVCPDGFFRKGNVDIVCARYRIKQYRTLEEVCNALRL